MLRFMVVVVVMIVGVFVIVELEVEIFGEQLKIMWAAETERESARTVEVIKYTK